MVRGVPGAGEVGGEGGGWGAARVGAGGGARTAAATTGGAGGRDTGAGGISSMLADPGVVMVVVGPLLLLLAGTRYDAFDAGVMYTTVANGCKAAQVQKSVPDRVDEQASSHIRFEPEIPYTRWTYICFQESAEARRYQPAYDTTAQKDATREWSALSHCERGELNVI